MVAGLRWIRRRVKVRIPHSPISLVRWTLNARPRFQKSMHPAGRRVAGVMPTRDYSENASVFETLQELCDVTIVLDDNSAMPFSHREECTEYIALRNDEPWNAPANLTLLLFRAFMMGCEWIISLDDDIIPAHTFRTRQDVDEVVDFMESKKLDICRFELKELWDSLEEIRVDGVWSRKDFPVVRRNWFFYEGMTLRDPSQRLHTAAFPVSHRSRSMVHPEHRVYHTGCLTPAMRRARVAKYGLEDPHNQFQSDYSYMLDDSGLAVEAVPAADARVIREKCRIDPQICVDRNKP